MDRRVLVIKQYSSGFAEETLHTTTVIPLPSSSRKDADDVVQRILMELNAVFSSDIRPTIDGYEIKDTRRIISYGASSSDQEIIFAIVSSVAGSAATLLIQNLSDWARKRFAEKQDERQLGRTLESLKSLISQHFRPEGPLEIVEVETTQWGMRVVIQDLVGNRYEMEVTNNTLNDVSIKKIVPQASQGKP